LGADDYLVIGKVIVAEIDAQKRAQARQMAP
jgi:hypothetical protein